MFQNGRALLLLFIISTSNAQSFFDLLKSYMNPMEGIHVVYSPRYKEYDFIIVGAGSGGSVLANRLSENSNWKILLLEAGDTELLINQIPMACALAQVTKQNWGYNVTPQKNCCLGMINRQCSFPRGRVTGGTSVLNYMIHTRGNKLDYDIWAGLGNKGWSYRDVLPYFKKSERFKVPGRIDYTYHNKNGHLCVEHAPYHTELATAFLRAGQELGYDVLDYNGEEQVGFSYLQLNMDQGARCSAATAYLRNLQRPNLDIVLGARVTRVLIDKNKRAYGVEYVKNNKWNSVRSTKETILSAGTIDSPKLLMLSGIGPKSHLEKLGINVIQDLKVGYNLYEHVGFLGLVFKINASLSLLPTTFMNPAVPLSYAKDRSGPISIPGGAEAISFMRTKYAQDSRPDVELLFVAGSMHSDNGLILKKALRITDEVYNGFYKPLELQHAWSIWPIVQHPRSVGILTLKSKNPFDDPIIETNFLTHPADIEIILEGVKRAINVSKTAAFQAYDSTVWDKKVPGCEKYESGSDDYWRCAIKYLPSMMNHEIGTCKMGPNTDPDAVVDPELKVYGIEGLRVVDASIMPTMPNGHVNAGIYMIGEKAADMIKNQWQR